ncbi:unnamed protein product [Rotaria sp. Silwood1]|nr:unnamed protein product [Rotaria sp. Silwood1]
MHSSISIIQFYSTDNTFIHGNVDRLGCVEQHVIGPENISQRINDLNLQDCHAKIRQIESHSTIDDGVVVQITGKLSNNGVSIRRFRNYLICQLFIFLLADRASQQGLLYLSVNYLCFYSNILGKDITLVIKFTDIIVSYIKHFIHDNNVFIYSQLNVYIIMHQKQYVFYSTDNTFIHGSIDRLGCVEQHVIGPENISQRINDLNLQDCHAKIRQIESHSTIGDGVVVQVTGKLSNNGVPIRRFMQTFVLTLRQPKKFYSTDNTFIHGSVDRLGCVEQHVIGPENISQRINDLNLQDCHAKIRQIGSHSTIGDGVVVQVTGKLSNNGVPIRRFMQTFVLTPRQPKKYYVQNDSFHYQDEVFDDGSDEVDENDRSSLHIYGDSISSASIERIHNYASEIIRVCPRLYAYDFTLFRKILC